MLKTLFRDNTEKESARITDCGGIKPDDLLPPSYYEGQIPDHKPELDKNGDIIPGQHP